MKTHNEIWKINSSYFYEFPLSVVECFWYAGDLHGNLPALLAMESALWPSGTALAPARLLFLGDYVDRGPHGSELMAYLLAAKLQRPHAVLLLRGNHETRDIQKMFTFYKCAFLLLIGPPFLRLIHINLTN